MKCKQFLLLVSDYIDGTLPRTETDELEQHLIECKRCRTFINTLKATISLCQSLYDIPASIHQTLHHTIRQEWEIRKVEVTVGVPKFPFGEIVELKNKIEISIALPGVNKEDITLIVGQDYIQISGFKKKMEDILPIAEGKVGVGGKGVHAKGIYYINEITYGPFSRKFKLPSQIDPSKAQAYLENGVLKVTLSKA